MVAGPPHSASNMLPHLLFILCLRYIPATGECECRNANFGIDVRAAHLKSPGYPANYCNNLNCKYEIDGVPGKSVHLSIVSFETEQRHDFLEIHETFQAGSGQQTAKIATLSGKDIGWPLYASSEGSGFILRFVTDSSEMFGGFHARFSRANASRPGASCPRLYHEAIATEQALPSPPSSFEYKAGCAFMINTTQGNAIKLNFKQVSPEVSLKVYETENYNLERKTQALAEISGLFTKMPLEVVSRTKSVMVTFSLMPRSPDAPPSATPDKLFSAGFYRTESPCNCFSTPLTVESRTAKYVTSPGFPGEYCDSLNCPLDVEVEHGPRTQGKHCVILMKVLAFTIEHGADFLHLFDKLSRSTQYLISRTGELDLARNRYFTFNGDMAELRFVTDSTVVNNGFNVSLIALERDNDCKCPGEAQPVEYTAVSGDFSLSAPSSCLYLDCFFHISHPRSAAPGERLRLLVNVSYEFKGAQEEYLEVLRGIGVNIIPSHTTDTDITIYEPGVSREGTEEVNNEEPTRFWYHLAATAPGGNTNIKFQYEWRPICKCGELDLEVKSGEWKRLTSPDYPSFYCNSMKCQYLITAPPGHIIAVNITEVSLEPNEDLVAIFDGPNITNKRLELATGIQMFTYLIRGSGNQMTIYFESDVSISNKGFVLFFTAEDKSGGSSEGAGSQHHLLMYMTLLVVLVICCGVGLVSYQRNMFCFANRRQWQGSVVGFSNITHSSSATSDERSLFG